MPSAASPGEVISVRLEDLWAACTDTGGGPPKPLDTVHVSAQLVSDPEDPVVQGEADVEDDASAVVKLRIPADAHGTLIINAEGTPVGRVQIHSPVGSDPN